MEHVLLKVKMANWVVTAACLVVGVGLWVAFGHKLPPQIPLLYTKPWGEGQLVKPIWLLGLPIIAAGVGMGLGWLGEKLKKEIPLAVMVVSTSMIFQIVVVLAMLRVVLFVM